MDAKDIRALLASQRDQKFRKRTDAQINRAETHRLLWKTPGYKEKVVGARQKTLEETDGYKTYQGKTIKQWAEELGVSESTIHCTLRDRGNLDNCGKGLGQKRKFQGKTVMEWAREKNCDISTIYKHIDLYGHLDNIGKRPNVKKIVYEGKTYKQLEEEYGVNSKTIRNHLKLHGNLTNLTKKQ